MATLLNSSKENIDALSIKIEQQKKLLKLNKNDTYLKNVIQMNKNTLSFLKTKHFLQTK